jgi:methyltransferase (TIGR00027 family)
MVVRTAVMDEIILRCVKDGATVVLNIAAGLDTRAYRLDLPASLTWFHVDFPDVVEYVKGSLAGETPRCRLEYAAADMTNHAERSTVFARAAAAAGSGWVLVIAEGLLVYLEREDVAKLAKSLSAQAPFRGWLIDLASPMLLEWLSKRWGRRLQDGNAPMKFGPAEGTAFFEPCGWREKEFRSTWDEAIRLKRTMRGVWLWKLLSRLQPAAKREAGRRMSGIVLLERR